MRQPSWYPDYFRATQDEGFVLRHFIRDFLFQHRLRYMIYFRTARNTQSKLVKLLCEYRLLRMCRKFGIEIKSRTNIGKGFLMIHPYNITVSTEAVLGNNVTMLKGSTVGVTYGKHAGAPKIGNCVYIGINSTVVSNIEVGDDVVIAPNTLVNRDIPPHSLVIGNPCRIISRENATADYIWKKV